jgi:hypothetical protein
VTQTTQELETLEQTEKRLWKRYVAARLRYHEVWLADDKAWREYVTTKNESARKEWEHYAHLSDSWRDRARETYEAWKQVAYPLYDWPLDNEEDK